MKAYDLKSLAELIASQSRIDKKVMDYIMMRLTLSDLKLFKNYLDQEIVKKTLFVQTAKLSSDLKPNLEKLFPERVINISENHSLGAGLYIIDGDNHYDLSVRNKIETIIEELKN